MKIVHVCLCGPMTDGWTYQENLLTKYHKLQEHDVSVIASQWIWKQDGTLGKIADTNYFNEDGVKVVRIPLWFGNINTRLRVYRGLYKALINEKPDVLFVHDCQFLNLETIRKYVKKHKVKLYIDNHSDESNSARNALSRIVLHKIIWGFLNRRIVKYVKCYYGVLPARVDFLVKMYRLPKEKCKLLVMGADDISVANYMTTAQREKTRKAWGVTDDDIVILTGGKIDTSKKQVLLLMSAINKSSKKNIILMVFGSVVPELKEEFESKLSDSVRYLGWKTADEIYEEYAGADILAFPGRHSVLWEQAVGMGKPCVFKRIEGFDHVDVGGNCLFFEEENETEYGNVIGRAVSQLAQLKRNAEQKGIKEFSYSDIAKRSLEG